RERCSADATGGGEHEPARQQRSGREMIQCFFHDVDNLLPQMRGALEKGNAWRLNWVQVNPLSGANANHWPAFQSFLSRIPGSRGFRLVAEWFRLMGVGSQSFLRSNSRRGKGALAKHTAVQFFSNLSQEFDNNDLRRSEPI